MLKQELMDVVMDTRSLLQENQADWSAIWAGYAEAISQNQGVINRARKSFHERPPLRVYLNIGQAIAAKKSVKFDLRYLGQTVAVLTVKEGECKLSMNGFYKTNLRDFGCDQKLHQVDWDSEEGRAFTAFFKDRQGPRNDVSVADNEEHRLEDLWITELLDKDNKELPNVQVVEIGEVRFAMKTPLKGSTPEELQYAGRQGGGIDILARGGIGGNASLCILELKSKSGGSKASIDALKQAVAYDDDRISCTMSTSQRRTTKSETLLLPSSGKKMTDIENPEQSPRGFYIPIAAGYIRIRTRIPRHFSYNLPRRVFHVWLRKEIPDRVRILG